MKNFLPIVDVS